MEFLAADLEVVENLLEVMLAVLFLLMVVKDAVWEILRWCSVAMAPSSIDKLFSKVLCSSLVPIQLVLVERKMTQAG